MNQTKTLMAAGFTVANLIFLMSFELPDAFADRQVIITTEATNRNCKQDDTCYSNSGIIINNGQTVTWVNDDLTIHHVKSGSRDIGVNGLFASKVIMPGKSFSHSFKQSGMFSYYCPSHPWMYGVVYVR